MNDKKPWMIVAVRLAVVGVGAYLWLRKPPPETPLPVVAPPAVPVASVVAPSPAVEALPILHPLDAPPPAQPLPSLDASDAPLAQLLAGLLGGKPWRTLFVPEAIIRRIVAIDDLLETPEPAASPRLVQEKVRYRFADADLDRRSAGQKILLRIGVAHARLAKQRLAAPRRALMRPTSATPNAINDEKRRPAT
ncbi:MAG: hypothetical protein A3H93_12935 [Rhodocyclales bacterium RIFCSPLOWO2_02_FULL_63_24]|nr:MAG: hypothetical protein A2040_16315 [Rhodocyclales bacterium GWA2_65_19]OHC68903.1 MAG: hypothetical protein A3H93_12935 [Rhodocyclales bacterium RIFCSPLOWO2_02_FULL_63_24]